MQTKRPHDGAPITTTVTLAVEEGYTLHPFYAHASPSDIGRALMLGATLLNGEVPPLLHVQTEIDTAIVRVKQECLERREGQLKEHEARMAAITASHGAELESQRSTLQAEIALMAAKHAEEVQAVAVRIKDLVNENDDLEARVSAMEEGGVIAESDCNHEAVRSHFQGFAQHTCDVLAALAKHHALIDKLDRSAVHVRAKLFTYYRQTKKLSASTDWLNVCMELPFETAYEHAIAFDRPSL
jgi:hypothetical protein